MTEAAGATVEAGLLADVAGSSALETLETQSTETKAARASGRVVMSGAFAAGVPTCDLAILGIFVRRRGQMVNWFNH